MTTAETVRHLALGFPEAREVRRANGKAFLVGRATFAALAGPRRLRIMLGPQQARDLVAAHPDLCRSLTASEDAALVIDLDRAGEQFVEDLLAEAWYRKAPPAMVPGRTGRPRDLHPSVG